MSQTIVLICPNCSTKFGAPVEQFLPKGRQVRCSECRHIWFHGAPAKEAAAKAKHIAPTRPANSDASPVQRKTLHAPLAQRPENGGMLIWLLRLVALTLIAAILVYVFQDPLRRAAPKAAPWLDRYTNTVDATAHSLVGHAAKNNSLEWRNIQYDIKEYDGKREVLVKADLFNIGDVDESAPQVRVRLVDADREQLHGSVIRPEDGSGIIRAAESTRYFARITEPPADFDAVLLDIYEE